MVIMLSQLLDLAVVEAGADLGAVFEYYILYNSYKNTKLGLIFNQNIDLTQKLGLTRK